VGIALAMGVTGAASWILHSQIADGQVVYAAFAAPLYSLLRWVSLIAVVVAGVAYLVAGRSRNTPSLDREESP
jgi:hypothetical protein